MKESKNTTEKDFLELWDWVYEQKNVVVFDASLFPSYLLIDTILILPSGRKQGLGSLIMKKVCEFADLHRKDILLLPDEDMGTALEVLIYFYGNFDFTIHKGVKYEGDWIDYLLREPVDINKSLIFD